MGLVETYMAHRVRSSRTRAQRLADAENDFSCFCDALESMGLGAKCLDDFANDGAYQVLHYGGGGVLWFVNLFPGSLRVSCSVGAPAIKLPEDWRLVDVPGAFVF